MTSVAMIGKFGPYPGGVPDVPSTPSYGDDRQGLLFGAAWAVSSLRQLVDAEAASATYFELSGSARACRHPWRRDEYRARAGTGLPGPRGSAFLGRRGNLVRVGRRSR